MRVALTVVKLVDMTACMKAEMWVDQTDGYSADKKVATTV